MSFPNPYTSTLNDLLLAVLNHLGTKTELEPRDIPNVYNDTTNDLLLSILAKITESSGKVWELGGNTVGTESNKLGTIDDKDLEIIRENVRYILLEKGLAGNPNYISLFNKFAFSADGSFTAYNPLTEVVFRILYDAINQTNSLEFGNDADDTFAVNASMYLPNLPDAASLATDANGKIIAGANIFPNNPNTRIYTAIVRVYVDTATNNVIWTLLDDTDHDPIGISGISTPNSTTLRVTFSTPFKKVFGFTYSNDETLQAKGVQAGASFGLSFADIRFSVPYQGRTTYNYNGTTWGIAISGSPSIASITQNGNNIVITNPTSIYGTSSNASFANLPVYYAGTNNRVLRYVTSGVGFNQTILQLVDPTTGTVVAPNSSDRLVIFSPQIMNPLNTQTNSNATSLELYAYGSDPNIANIWLTFIGEV